MTRTGRLATLTALTALVMLVAGPAFGAWNLGGSGNGAGAATSLVASGSAAVGTPPSTAIDVTFTTVGNPLGTTYSVSRTTGPGGTGGPQVVCASPAVSPCHDTGLSPSTAYSYTVTAALASWTATGSAGSATTAAVVLPTVTSPTTSAPAVFSHNPSHVNVTVTGTGFQSGVTVSLVAVDNVFTINSVTFNSSTQVTLNVSASGGTNKKDGFKLTNPDGGAVTCASCLKNG